jgi:acyl carrier protein phosphodiesterase
MVAMNYLAHLYLAEQSGEGLLGSLLGDFVKGPLDDRFPEVVRRGIALHRAIDSFTDAHPLHLESRNRIGKTRRRYAGIIIDVCYDHFLSRHWTRYSSETLAAFAERAYDVLREHRDALPDRLRRIAPHMIADDWLGSYGDLANVGRALDGIARRIKRSNTLAGALAEVEANYAALDDDFQRFFPELEAQAGRIQAALVRRPETD